MIDINKPVEQGHDLILNYDGKEASLGTDTAFNEAVSNGELISLPPNDNPDTPQVVIGDVPEEDEEVKRGRGRPRKAE